jgi:hypothetical protein
MCTSQFAYRPTGYTSSQSLQSQQQHLVKSTEAYISMFKSITARHIISNFGVLYIISHYATDFDVAFYEKLLLKFGRILIWLCIGSMCLLHYMQLKSILQIF